MMNKIADVGFAKLDLDRGARTGMGETVFAPGKDFDGNDEWWAPECHFYQDAFYLFASYHSAASNKRGTAIFRADNPLGPFALITDGHITPKERDCIDGTLYVDEDGQPWMIYVGEWI